MRKYIVFSMIVLLVFTTPVDARTRQKSIENFIDRLRLSDDGYAGSVSGEVNITSTTDVLEIASLIDYKINNSLDILLFYQESQNDSGGFSAYPNENVTWENTISAVRGLTYLDVNVSQVRNWKIYDYINKTAFSNLYTTIVVNNITKTVPYNLTLALIDYYAEYIISAFKLGFIPTIDSDWLVYHLKQYQFSNGSYSNFQTAVKSIHLLTILGQSPTDLDLATKYIRAFIQNNGAFSDVQEGPTSLLQSYYGIRALYELNQIETIEYMNELIIYILELQKTNSGFVEVGYDDSTAYHTWLAVSALFMLNRIHELLSPDVLQTEGFITLNMGFVPFILLIPILRRKYNG